MTFKLLLALLCWVVPTHAGDRYGLAVSGVPSGAEPAMARRLHTHMHYGANHSVVTQPATTEYFWEPEPEELHIRVVITKYYRGRKQKVLLPLISARYSYEMQAAGMAAVYSPESDSLIFRAPFAFAFERPIAYQLIGIHSDLPSAQMNIVTQHRLEGEALDALSLVLLHPMESGAGSAGGPR